MAFEAIVEAMFTASIDNGTHDSSQNEPAKIAIQINSYNWTIQTIRICVMPENALTGGKEDIGRDEPAYLRIVVTGPEVVEARLFVIHISTITEGIILSECGRE